MSDNALQVPEPEDLVTEVDTEPQHQPVTDPDDIDVPDDIVAPQGYGVIPPWEA